MKTGCIYRITNLLNSKVYIGKTTHLFLKRFKKHLANAKFHRDNSQLGKAIRKHGEHNFYIGIIVDNVPTNFLDIFEQYWINYFDSLKAGYNLTAGGDGGSRPWTAAQRKKMSEQRRGITVPPDVRIKISQALKAKPMSAEHKQKMTEARSKLPHPGARKVRCVETGTILLSAKAAADWLSISTNSNILNVCKGNRAKAGGYTWEYTT